MKVPALKAELGGRTFYVTTLTFQQVNDYVSPIDDQLHKSETLNDLIQRSITKNYLSIKDYILNQSELFFNSLVLAVYDNYPDWSAIELKYDDESTYQVGLLDFPGEHKIFPVDGQHRVEGIKAALKEKPEIKNEKIAAIFIGHKNDNEGKESTRRIFATLNRYAKPVSLEDIIALDEDDIVAITTRYLVEYYDLFAGNRVVYAKQKGIPGNNKTAITSIITLYQANTELFLDYYQKKYNKKLSNAGLVKYQKFRPNKVDIEAFNDYVINFWDAFKSISVVATYLADQSNDPIKYLRNNETGGNLIFRPIGLLPLIKAALVVQQRTSMSFVMIFKIFDSINLDLNKRPWPSVLWDPINKKMLANADVLTQQLLIYLFDKSLLSDVEMDKLKKGYASKISFEGDVNRALD